MAKPEEPNRADGTKTSPVGQEPRDKAKAQQKPPGDQVTVFVENVPGLCRLDPTDQLRGGTWVSGSHEGGKALATATTLRMSDFWAVVTWDPRWAAARSHKAIQPLTEALRLVNQAWIEVSTGFILANTADLTPWEVKTLLRSIKTAKRVSRSLAGLPSKKHWEYRRKAGPVLYCAEAWLEVLPLVKDLQRRCRGKSTQDVVRAVIDNAKPELSKRLRLPEAIKNAATKGKHVFDLIRSSPPRTRWSVAYELAGLACGVDSVATVRHMCVFARAYMRDVAREQTPTANQGRNRSSTMATEVVELWRASTQPERQRAGTIAKKLHISARLVRRYVRAAELR